MAETAKLSSNLLRLQKLFLDSPVDIVATLSNVVRGSDEINVISRALAIFVEDKKSFDILRWCVNDNVDSSDQYQDLFRDRTLGTQILSEWCTTVSRVYMRQTLGPTLKKLAALKKALEADPRVMVANLDDNRAKLRELAEELTNTIISQLHQCPPELRNLLFYMSRRLTERFESERLRVLTVFLFSRVFIPPLLNPSQFNLIKDPWTPEAARTGILLAKVIGNLSSGVQFEEHNPLQAFNEFLNLFREKIEKYVEDLIAPAAESDPQPSEHPSISPELASNAFRCIHYFLYWSKDAIVAYRNQESVKSSVSPTVARLFFDLLGIVEDIELAEGKPDPIEMSMLDFENPSSTLQSGKRSPTKLMPKPAALPRPRPERSSSALPPLASGDKAAAPAPQMVRRISEKWNRQLQLDAIRQKQEREAAEKRAQNKAAHQKASEGKPGDAPTREGSDPSLTASTDSSTDKEKDKRAQSTSSSKPKSTTTSSDKPAASSSAPASPAGKPTKRKLAPSLTAIGAPAGSKKSSRATVSFGAEVPLSTEEDGSSESRESNNSSPSRSKPGKSKSEKDKPPASPKPSTPTPAAPVSTTGSSTPSLKAPSNPILSPRGASFSTGAVASPRPVEKSPSSSEVSVDQVPPSDKNVESLSTVVRNLGVENAQLIKVNKDLTAKVEQLQLEIARLQQEVAEAHSSENKMKSYTARLAQTVKSRRQTEARVRQAQTKSLYSIYHSFDDSQIEFGKATPEERREWVLQQLGRQAVSSDAISRRTSTAFTLLKSLPEIVETKHEDTSMESARSEGPQSSRSHGSPRDAPAPDPKPEATEPESSTTVSAAPSAPADTDPAKDSKADDASKDKKRIHSKTSSRDKDKDKDRKSSEKHSTTSSSSSSKDKSSEPSRRSRSDSKKNTLRKTKLTKPEGEQSPNDS